MTLKRLILSSAATMILAGAGQAADLPAAEPVDYVRVCDAFGTGYFFLPGTDTCLKMDGYVRAEMHWLDGTGPKEGKDYNNFSTRARGRVRFDARTQTDLGLLRSHIEMRGTIGPAPTGGYSDNFNIYAAWLSLSNDAGTLTAGHHESFYDFWDGYATDTRIGLDDATNETNLLAYTFDVGNGVSASVSIEDKWVRRRGLAVGITTTAGGLTGIPTTTSAVTGAVRLTNEGQEIPDFIGNIRVEQSWGKAQVMGAVGRVGGAGFTAGTGATEPADNDIGWAAGGGVHLKNLGPAEFVAQGDYAEGLVRYITTGNSAEIYNSAYSASGNLDLTKAWAARTSAKVRVALDVALAVDFAYASIDHRGLLDKEDYDTWALAGTFEWKPVSGLTFKTSVAYEEIDADSSAVVISDEDSWGIEGRIERSF